MFLFWSIILLCIIDLFVVWGNVTYELVCLSILKQARVGGGGAEHVQNVLLHIACEMS